MTSMMEGGRAGGTGAGWEEDGEEKYQSANPQPGQHKLLMCFGSQTCLFGRNPFLFLRCKSWSQDFTFQTQQESFV